MPMTLEVFDEKVKRNQRFNALREAGVKHVTRYSSIREIVLPDSGKRVWRDCYNLTFPTKLETLTTVEHFQNLAAENTVEAARTAQRKTVAAFDELLNEIKPDASSDEAPIEQAISEGSPVVSAGANEVGAVA
jgi:hypothetical protein